MKTRKLKNIGWLALAVACGTIGSSYAQVQSPLSEGTSTRLAHAPAQSTATDPFEEGTETKLSPDRIAEYETYVRSSLAGLRDLVDQSNTMTDRAAKKAFVDEIQSIVAHSAPRKAETLMRHILNRALKVVGQIDLADNTLPGILDQEVRVLKQSVKLALEYSENDVTYLRNMHDGAVSPLPYADFGKKYVKFIMQVNESLLSPKVGYAIASDALGGLMVELDKDDKRENYRDVITKLYRFVQEHPLPTPATGVEAAADLRKVHFVYHSAMRELDQVSPH